MTSREIIIKLIDNKSINGEEAYILLNDIFKGEMVAVNEALHPKSITSIPIWTTADYSNSTTASVSSK